MSIGNFGAALLVGLLASSMSKNYASSSPNHSSLQAASATPSVATPTTVQAPEVNDEGTTAKAMDNAAEEEKAALLARRQANNDVLTSGLGVSGLAKLQKSSLLGA